MQGDCGGSMDKGDHNPAGSMTKHDGNKALDYIIELNKLCIEAEGWVECK
jgi:hypothetical protein